MRKPFAVLAACLLFLTLLPSAGVRAGSPARALVIGVLHLPQTLDPLLANPLLDPTAFDVTTALFDSLLTTDSHDMLQPDLATGYTVSATGMRYVFHLDPRAHWDDGLPVTADDVLFTTKLMRDPSFHPDSRYGFGSIATIASAGQYTVVVTLRAPYAPFLRAFATTPLLPSHVLSPIPSSQIEQYSAFNRRPTASGPYSFGSLQEGTQLTLQANPTYFRGTPRIQTLVFHQEPDSASALSDLKAGRIGMIAPSAGLTPDQVLDATSSGKSAAYAAPGSGWSHIDLIESGFLRDRLVRQALADAIPRQRLVATVFKGLAAPADADQPPTSMYYDPGVAGLLPYSPATVGTLLHKRGFSLVTIKGRTFYRKAKREFKITLWLDSTCAECRTVAGMVARSWEDAHIATTIRTVDTHTLFDERRGPLYRPDRLSSPNLNAVLYTWTTIPEPDDSLYWSSSMIVRPGHPTGLNFVGYRNPSVDQLVQQALDTPHEAARIAAYRAIQRRLVADQPAIFLYWTTQLSLATPSLHDYEPNAFHTGVTWDVMNWRLS